MTPTKAKLQLQSFFDIIAAKGDSNIIKLLQLINRLHLLFPPTVFNKKIIPVCYELKHIEFIYTCNMCEDHIAFHDQ